MDMGKLGAITLNRDKKKTLEELIKKDGIKFSFDKPIKLSGGGESYYYYDIKSVGSNPRALEIIAELGLEIVSKCGARSVGGIESGSISIATIISDRSKIPWFYVRKQPKEHGLMKYIEGELESPVLIVDDVTTRGKSVLDAVSKITAEGYEVIGVVTVVDREEGAVEELAKKGIELFPIFTHSEFKEYIESFKPKVQYLPA